MWKVGLSIFFWAAVSSRVAAARDGAGRTVNRARAAPIRMDKILVFIDHNLRL